MPSWVRRFTTLEGQVNWVLFAAAAAGAFFFGFKTVAWQVAVALLTTFTVNEILLQLVGKGFRWPDSPIVSGLIISLVFAPSTPWYVLVTAGVAGMLAKFLVRFKGKHIFNPAASGILIASLLFPHVAHGWWSDRVVWLMALLGLTVIVRFKRLHLVTSFLLMSLLIFIGFSLVTGLGFEGFLPRFLTTLSPLFILIMLPEPQTSPPTVKTRSIYAALTAVLVFVWSLLKAPDPLVFGLLTANLAVPLLRRIP